MGEKKSTAKLKDENGETHGFQNSVAQVGPEPEPAEANRVNGQAGLV